MHGSGGSFAAKNSSHGSGTFKHTVKANGGVAEIGVETHNGSSASSGGAVTISGNVTATGPVAGVNVHANGITITGNVTTKGSGGSVATHTTFTPSSGPGAFSTSFSGPGRVTGVSLEGNHGALNVGGTVKVTGPGLTGAEIVGKGVTVGAVSGSASAALKYKILDTRKAATATSFTASSFTLLTTGINATGFSAANVKGNVTLNADRKSTRLNSSHH